MLDRFDLYELCVQSPRHVVSFLRGVHGQEPVILREDFCGTAAVARRWCAEAIKAGRDDRAFALDLDTDALAKASTLAKDATPSVAPRIAFHRGDCTLDRCPAADDGADVIFVGNFSIGYIHRRSDLVRYLKRCRYRLKRGGMGTDAASLAAHGFISLAAEADDSPTTAAASNGVFVCDTYGGASAFKLGGFERQHPGKRGEIIRYYWSHDAADPRTAMVENSISFRVQVNGEIVQDSPRAFVYRWRLWSIAELREALTDAGFTDVEVYKDVNVAPGQAPKPVTTPAELGEDWIVLIVARA